MTKIKFNYSSDGIESLDTALSGISEPIINSGHTQAMYGAEDSGTTMTMYGKNLKIDADTGLIVSGTVNKILFEYDGGEPLKISGGDYKAKDLGDVFVTDGVLGLIGFVGKGSDDRIDGGDSDDRLYGYSGDDKISGGTGSDFISGGFGNDVLAGGADSDSFVFNTNGSSHMFKDVITDFDISGDDADSFVTKDEYDLSKAGGGADTLVTFSNGDTVVLQHVTMADFIAFME